MTRYPKYDSLKEPAPYYFQTQESAPVSQRLADQEIWYGHSIFTSSLFPQSPPKEPASFIVKRQVNYEYILEAGIDPATKTQKFPYGKYPRMIMCWIAKRIRMAGKKGDKYVDPEKMSIRIPSLSHLVAELGIAKGGVTLCAINEQIRALTLCRISVHKCSGFVASRNRRAIVNLPLTRAIVFNECENIRENGFVMILTPEIWNILSKETAPFDFQAAKALLKGRRVMAHDIYIWMVGTYFNMRFPRNFSWHWLHETFGDGLNDERNFRFRFRRNICLVNLFYPQARFEITKDGVTLIPSRPAIEPRRSSRH